MLINRCCTCAAPSTVVTCGTCNIPKTDLTSTMNPLGGASYSWPMIWDGVATWDSGCVAHFATGHFRTILRCSGGLTTFQWITYSDSACATPGGSCQTFTPVNIKIDLPNTTCTPYHLHIIPSTGTNCGGLASFDIDG